MILKTFGRANNARLPNPSNVGDACGAENVRKMWLHHYQSLLNSVPEPTVHIHKIDMYCSNIQISDNMVVKVKELQELTIAMPVGKVSISATNILSMLTKNYIFLGLCFIVVC